MTTGSRMDVSEAPRPLGARDRRAIIVTIAIVILGGFVVWQLFGLVTVKDTPPPSGLIAVPAGATIVGEPRIDQQPYRATTYVTVRPADGRTPLDLMSEMGVSDEPTQIGPFPWDWRTAWVYAVRKQDDVELRLVYLRDGEGS